jgi:multidrug resistance efflux pump
MKKLLILVAVIALSACTPEAESGADAHEETTAAAPTNRIDIPGAVVRNLGITFATVEKRRVAQTLRLPGAFEAPPEARRQYRAPVGGRVSWAVNQYDMVEAGAEIASIASHQWGEMQRELDAMQAEVDERTARHTQAAAETAAEQAAVRAYPRRIEAYAPQLAALQQHEERLVTARDQWKARVADLEELAAKGGGRATELAEARAELASAEAAISEDQEKRAELERAKIELALEQEVATARLDALRAAENAALLRKQASGRSFALKLAGAATQLGVKPPVLADGAWRKLARVPVYADAPGVVLDLHVHTDEIVDPGETLCRVMDPSRVRFRARALQADLGRLKSGLSATVAPPAGGTLEAAERAAGAIILAPVGEAESRLVDVLMSLQQAPGWARPGVTAELEVVWNVTAEPELSIPNRAIVQDGLHKVIFHRDPADPAKVIRVEAVLGPSDGRWTVVYGGGLGPGHEVVLDGVYELKLTGAGKALGEGHFHADGTFHAGAAHD